MIVIVSAAWWFIKLRPSELKTRNEALDGLSKKMEAIREKMHEDRTMFMECIAFNSSMLENCKDVIEKMQSESLENANNCDSIMDALKALKQTQNSLIKQYKNMSESVTDIKSNYAVMDETMKDIKQDVKDCK